MKGTAMAKRKGKKESSGKAEKKESPFWKPDKVGDEISGKFLAFQEGSVEENGKKKATANIVLDNGKLIPFFWSIVHSDFRDIAGTLKPGTKLRFQYAGKGGRSKTVKMWVNGKEMKIYSAFENIPSKAISKFLVK